MFIGEFHHTLDEKNRVSIPKKFRQDLDDGLVITRGLDGCLYIYTKSEWNEKAEQIASLPMTKRDARAFQRHMFSGAMDMQMDKQGRIVMPDYLKKESEIDKKLVITGIYDRLEVWNEEKWNKYLENNSKESDEIAESMSELGI
jgi:MraZ protein